MKGFNYKERLIISTRYFDRVGLYKDSLYNGSLPVNEVFWGNYIETFDLRGIKSINLRYVHYIDRIMENVKPFKKD